MSAKLRGIFTPTLVPLDARGQINETELRRFISWLIDRGVHGLYPNGSTGEFTRLTAEERNRIVKIVCDETRGRVPVLAGAAEANVKETLNACAAYADMGAEAVAIVSPYYFRLSPESVYAYFAEIARHSPIDITLYNIPSYASPIDVPTIRRLALEFPRVVGIKDSSGALAFMMRMISAVRPHRPDFSFVTRRIFELSTEGKFDEAMKWNYRILELFDAMLYPFEFPDGFRAAAELRGFNFGVGRQPQSPAQKSDREALAKVLHCILADFELVAPPPSGCAPRIHQPEQDKIKQVVWDVLFELEKRGVV